MATITHRLWVCLCCMLTHANGECCSDHPADEPQPWTLWERETHRLAMGDDSDDYATGVCNGCGTTLHGPRWEFVAFDK